MDSEIKWQILAKKELKVDKLDTIRVSYGENRYIDPIYSKRENLDTAEGNKKENNWINTELFSGEGKDNKAIILALEQGLSTLSIQYEGSGLRELLEGVHLEWITTFIYLGVDEFIKCDTELKKICEEKDINFESIELYYLISDRKGTLQNSERCIGLIKTVKKCPIEALTDFLIQSHNLLLKESFGKKTMWSIPIGDKQLEEISKFRASRILWKNICEYHEKQMPLLLQAELEGRRDEFTQIRIPYMVLNAILGGADIISTVNFNDAKGKKVIEENRLIRNIHSILREESKINKYADPTQGSYLLDHMTKKFCEWAWEDFVKHMNRAEAN